MLKSSANVIIQFKVFKNDVACTYSIKRIMSQVSSVCLCISFLSILQLNGNVIGSGWWLLSKLYLAWDLCLILLWRNRLTFVLTIVFSLLDSCVLEFEKGSQILLIQRDLVSYVMCGINGSLSYDLINPKLINLQIKKKAQSQPCVACDKLHWWYWHPIWSPVWTNSLPMYLGKSGKRSKSLGSCVHVLTQMFLRNQ